MYMHLKNVISLPGFLAVNGSSVYDKTMNMSVVYGIIAVISIALIAIGYRMVGNRKLRPMCLCVFVAVADIGYFLISISNSLKAALFWNGVAYLGCAALVLFMLLTICDVCRLRLPKLLTGILCLISFIVFLVAASPLSLGLYYSSAHIVYVNGMTIIDKTYGPLHIVYFLYLMAYFAMMLAAVFYSTSKKKIKGFRFVGLIITLVFLNLAIWGIQQLVYWQFEFLSISYILSEIILLFLISIMDEYGDNKKTPDIESPPEEEGKLQSVYESSKPDNNQEESISELNQKLPEMSLLTPRELEVFNCIVKNMKRKDIAEALSISENTVKTHTKNIYTKLGVADRNELFVRIMKL